ncbi:MAG: ubiquinol-cytochrome c reductase iron-sulfur subunit [Gammaproteobacteria bacterium]|nr:ubiquinol-cytochrome c reductase iron-sulfur subunit [Gammaproteobacteria bacterium]
MVDEVDEKRRDFLIKATTAMGAVGVLAAAVPFVASMLPSEDVSEAGAPIKVDISKLKPGEQLTVMWRGRPIWIIHRTPEALESLQDDEDLLRDPSSEVEQQPTYARNRFRSIKPEILVLVGICTHLGCIPTYRPDPKSLEPQWPGGFFCSCHGSKFDMAGRVFKGVPAPINLEVPSYSYVDDKTLLVGVDHEKNK